jgi:chromosomal replication initiation ATPase DnaA
MLLSPYLIPGLKSAGKTNKNRPEKEFRIIKYISLFTGITYKQMQQKTRKAKVLYARQLCTYILKKKTALTNDEISALFNQHRTTNYNSIKAIENYRYTNEVKLAELTILLSLVY